MTYALEKLLTIRSCRENRALNRLVQSKARLDRARIDKQHKESDLAEYRKWRPAEEQRLFEELKMKPAAVQDLISYIDTIGTLRETQAAKARQVDEAAGQTVIAEDELGQARREYHEACRKKLKIEEHKAVWLADHLLQAERAAENEIEELGKSGP